uniref:Uncharacterized protein n=1 Tax=Aegilops tauschii subsp. strangulata TaxID=200361 RepID=A0A453CRS1_AEGTS
MPSAASPHPVTLAQDEPGGALRRSGGARSKYRLVQALVDERDGSIYGAVLEWDRQAALSDYIPFRARLAILDDARPGAAAR